MSLEPWQFEIGGYLVGAGQPWGLAGVDGLSGIDVESHDTARTAGDGVHAGVDRLPARTVGLSLTLDEPDPAAFAQHRQDLAAAASLSRTGTKLLRWRMPGQTIRRMEVRPRRLHMPTADARTLFGVGSAELQLVAPSPHILSDLEQAASGTIEAQGTSVQFAVPNEGDADTWPTVLVVGGPCRNPRITNSTQGRAIRIDIDVSTGENLYIFPNERIVAWNASGEDPVYDAVRPDNEWWTLEPGGNTVVYSRSSTGLTGAASELHVQWRPAWWA